MLKREHAPRLILGMRSNETLSDATVAFARASKRIKAHDTPPFDIKDLTAALSQLEGHATDDLFFEFKVPANAALFDVDMSHRADDAPAHESLIASIEKLLRWEWVEAKQEAKEVLSQTQSEDLRDEALNVIAAASALSGDVEAGMAALQRAVEGEWNFALQQNLGILALESEPELAAQQSTYWLDSASTTDDRERALFFVLKMWSNLERNEDDEIELPDRIRDSFRAALNQDLTTNTFVLLGNFLAQNDPEWIQDPTNWVESPHFTADIGNMVLARAEGLEAFVDFLTDHAANTDPEIAQARENLVSDLVETMLEQETAIGAASVAVQLVEGGLPCDTLNNALLRPLAVREICLYLNDNDGEAKDEFVDWLLQFQRFAEGFDEDDLREFIEEILSNATALFIVGFAAARDSEIGAMEQPLNTVYQMSQSWGTRRRLNKPEARRLAMHVLEWSRQVQHMTKKLSALPTPDDAIREVLNEVIKQQQQAQRMATLILEKN